DEHLLLVIYFDDIHVFRDFSTSAKRYNFYVIVTFLFFSRHYLSLLFLLSFLSLSSFSINALREAFTRPCLSISVTLTSVSSPIFKTSSTFLMCLWSIFEM